MSLPAQPTEGSARSVAAEPARGRLAERPEQIPSAGWRDILTRVWKEIGGDNVSLVAAGLAMYALLAVFPALAAAVSMYGLFATPADVIRHMQGFAGILPPGAWDIFARQLQDIASHPQGTLTATAGIALVVALWSARSGMASLMTATNIAYSERERRGLVHQILLSLPTMAKCWTTWRCWLRLTMAAATTFIAISLLSPLRPSLWPVRHETTLMAIRQRPSHDLRGRSGLCISRSMSSRAVP